MATHLLAIGIEQSGNCLTCQNLISLINELEQKFDGFYYRSTADEMRILTFRFADKFLIQIQIFSDYLFKLGVGIFLFIKANETFLSNKIKRFNAENFVIWILKNEFYFG